jgi:hypothetical protein
MQRTTILRKVLPISLLALLSPSQAGIVSAGTNIWPSNGPEGESIKALVIDPATPTTLYAGTEGSVFAIQQVDFEYRIYLPIVQR